MDWKKMMAQEAELKGELTVLKDSTLEVRHEADHQMISATFKKALDADFIQVVAHGIQLVYFEYLKLLLTQKAVILY
ncbi:hypothetical protein ACRRTK_004013 [Alexandromys fortis]